jgi:hypothetical protein
LFGFEEEGMDTDFAEDDGKQWVDEVRQLFVARLPSLEEVNIAAWLSDDLVLLKKDKEPLSCPAWIQCGLTKIIEFFQQSKPKGHSTISKVFNDGLLEPRSRRRRVTWIEHAASRYLLNYQGTGEYVPDTSSLEVSDTMVPRTA